MKRLVFVALLAVCSCRPATTSPPTKFYVQLVRGTDDDTPPTSDSHPVGPQLRDRLTGAFKWKNYWELKRDALVVSPGGAVRRQLSPDRSVEIKLLDSEQMAVRVYSKSGLVRCRKQPVANAFYVTGGNLNEGQSWFIVVRRDEPLAIGQR